MIKVASWQVWCIEMFVRNTTEMCLVCVLLINHLQLVYWFLWCLGQIGKRRPTPKINILHPDLLTLQNLVRLWNPEIRNRLVSFECLVRVVVILSNHTSVLLPEWKLLIGDLNTQECVHIHATCFPFTLQFIPFITNAMSDWNLLPHVKYCVPISHWVFWYAHPAPSAWPYIAIQMLQPHRKYHPQPVGGELQYLSNKGDYFNNQEAAALHVALTLRVNYVSAVRNRRLNM